MFGKYCVLLLCLVFVSSVLSQRIVSIEVKHEVETIKIYENQAFEYRLIGDKEWFEAMIEQVIVDDNVLVTNLGLLNIADIDEIRFTNSIANGGAKLLMGFGLAWLGFGAVAHFAKRQDFDLTTLAIGSTAIGVGYLTKKVAGYKRYHIGKNARIRLLDLSF